MEARESAQKYPPSAIEPLVNVTVFEHYVQVTADMPLADPSTIRIRGLSQNVLEIAARLKRVVRYEELGASHRRGCLTCFYARVKLPVSVALEHMEWKFKNGYLVLRVPRRSS